jgi:hypothetical protein
LWIIRQLHDELNKIKEQLGDGGGDLSLKYWE